MEQLKIIGFTVSGLLLILVMIACTPTIEPGASGSDDSASGDIEENSETSALADTKWSLASLGISDMSSAGITLEFSEEAVSGSDGCNLYNSSYQIQEDKLIFEGPFASTMMACPDMEMGDKYMAALATAGQFSIQDGRLSIQTEQGDLVFEKPKLTELENTKWVLDSTTSELSVVRMAIDENIFFTISNGEIGGNGGCNGFGGSVEIDGSSINIGQMISTQMFCEADGISERKQEVFAILDAASSYEILRQSLTLFDENGSMLATFRAAKTNAELKTIFV
ncbi:MAG: META domain-containing protein [Chloroflexota bacterium]